MKDKKKKNRLWSGEFKLKVVLDIIENEIVLFIFTLFNTKFVMNMLKDSEN